MRQGLRVVGAVVRGVAVSLTVCAWCGILWFITIGWILRWVETQLGGQVTLGELVDAASLWRQFGLGMAVMLGGLHLALGLWPFRGVPGWIERLEQTSCRLWQALRARMAATKR